MAHQFAIRDQHGTSLRLGPTPGDKTFTLAKASDSFGLCQSRMDVEYSSNGDFALSIDTDKVCVC